MKSSASHAVPSLSRHIAAAKATMSIVPVVGNDAARGFAKNTNTTDAWFIYTSDRDARAFSGTAHIFSVAYQRGSARFMTFAQRVRPNTSVFKKRVELANLNSSTMTMGNLSVLRCPLSIAPKMFTCLRVKYN